MNTHSQTRLAFSHFLLRRGSILVLALVLLAGCGDGSAVEPELNLTGSWLLNVDGVCQGPLSIVQTGGDFTVSGSVGGGFCPYNANGTGNGVLSGRTINFGIGFGTGADSGGSGLGTVTFEGDVDAGGNRMSGRYEGPRGGNWEAVRQ
jgi:hypothetical protein